MMIGKMDGSLDVPTLLSSGDRDYLIRNNGDQVKIDDLKGKTLGLYFSDSTDDSYNPLIEVYQELSTKCDFEAVLISSDRDEESFKSCFSKMPWLSVPFSGSSSVQGLKDLFQVKSIPSVVIIDGSGQVLTNQGLNIIMTYGVDAYPFTAERICFLKEEEEAAKKNQSLRSLLVSDSRDYLISRNGDKVPVSNLEGKVVGLCFSYHSSHRSVKFIQKLADICGKLRERGDHSFEVVLISFDQSDDDFRAGLEAAPFLALPFKDQTIEKLSRQFPIKGLPYLPIIGTDGKTLYENASFLIDEHGIEAFPFSLEKVAELEVVEKAKQNAQTLEWVLVMEENDYVIDKSGCKIQVSELVGKNILLYFSTEACAPCRVFLPKLISAYNEIKDKDEGCEVIYISNDYNQTAFDEYFSKMPWLALPFVDPRKDFLFKWFRVCGLPSLVVLGQTGRTITIEGRQYINAHGAEAYPFTEQQIKKLEDHIDEIAKGWPEKVKHDLHPMHDLKKIRDRNYHCHGCESSGSGWCYACNICDFVLHPNCCLKTDQGLKDDKTEKTPMEGWICDGDVCRKA